MHLKLYFAVFFIVVNSSILIAQNTAMFPVNNFHMTESHSERSIPNPYLFDNEEGSLFTRESYTKNNKTYYPLYYNYYYLHNTSPNGHTSSGYSQRIVGDLNYDTLQNKVYLNDVLLYDFSLKVGDIYPITIQNPYFNSNIKVLNIDTIVDPYNITRKVFCVGEGNNSANCNFHSTTCTIIIEGIGNINGILGPIIDCFEDCSNKLTCAKIYNNEYELYNTISAGTCSIINNQKLSADFPDSNYYYNEGQSERLNEFVPFNELRYTVYYKKDTILNNITYQLLYFKYKTDMLSGPAPNTQGDIPIALLRNDKLNKQVYIKRLGFQYWRFSIPRDTTEMLLYDFSLKVGDYYKPNATQKVTVSDSLFVIKIDTIIDPDNIKRAVFIIDTKTSDLIWKGIVVEGIGGSNGLLGSIIDVMDWSYQENFTCYSMFNFFYEASFFDSIAILDYSHGPCKALTITSIQNKYLNEIAVYPNPTTDYVYYNINDINSEINIYNNIGIKVKQEKIVGNAINVNNLLPGIYFMQIRTDNKIYTSKFIKTD